jgi:hypothetical protein
MTTTFPTAGNEAVSIEIGGMPITLRTHDPSFRRLIENRYAGFLGPSPSSYLEFDIDLYEPSESAAADDGLEVKIEAGEWLLKRGDFRARWNPDACHGHIRQSCSPYAIDCVLRIVHSLILARQGGFLVHAASAIRGGKAFLFSGVSGAGKTTISRLAPPDATLLTDEISYVRREGNRYMACGTPFPRFPKHRVHYTQRLGVPLEAMARVFCTRNLPTHQSEASVNGSHIHRNESRSRV